MENKELWQEHAPKAQQSRTVKFRIGDAISTPGEPNYAKKGKAEPNYTHKKPKLRKKIERMLITAQHPPTANYPCLEEIQNWQCEETAHSASVPTRTGPFSQTPTSDRHVGSSHATHRPILSCLERNKGLNNRICV